MGRRIICRACDTRFTATRTEPTTTECNHGEIVTAMVVDPPPSKSAEVPPDCEILTAEILAGESTLSQDLNHYARELYTRRDLKAGIKILKELAGMITVGGFALSALTIWLPAVGITLSTATIARILIHVAKFYHNASETERKQIRAALSWIKGGFSLGERLLG
ncbi:MAG: hypothetical protein GXX96_10995 [Planctomycetaceae bacterium]|nr:hypothetical protein [Planctomycetaceae bacterium]